MDFTEEWAANEDGLAREAASLGVLLARLEGIFSPLLFGGRECERLLEFARGLPPTLAGFPLWLGFPIDDSPPSIQLDVSVLGGTRSARFFEDADLAAASGVAPLLRETGAAESPLRRIVGDRALLHCEIAAGRPAVRGIVLYPVRATLAGDGSSSRRQDFSLALRALTGAVGRTLNAAEHQQLERVWLALAAGMRVGAIGVFPRQRGRIVRLVLLGLAAAADVAAFLDRVGWPGHAAAVAAVLGRLEQRGALANMTLGVRFDLSAAGAAPTVELQIFSADTIYDRAGWFKDKACWAGLIDGLGAESLAVPEKLAELANWSMAARTLFGRAGIFLLLQRIHHFALAFGEDGAVGRVNAHVFMLMSRQRAAARTPGRDSRRKHGDR